MKMKDQLESAQPMKKHKAKSKKNELKKKKQEKLEAKKHSKEKKADKPKAAETNTRVTPSIVDQKSRLKQAESLDAETSNTNRQRASKSLTPMTKEEQLIAINLIIKRLLMDEITQGAALRELRVGVLGLRQDAYTELTGVSRKTLSEIENDKGNYTAEIINKVFKPFDLKVGLVPTSSQLLSAILIH